MSFRCAARAAALVMIAVEYCAQLQMLQYSSVGLISYLSSRYTIPLVAEVCPSDRLGAQRRRR